MNRAEDGGQALLITGSTGRIGRALRAIWLNKTVNDLPILWHGRQAGPDVDVAWDIGKNPLAALPQNLIVLHLAGRTAGTETELADNQRTTEAVCSAALAAKARHVFVMSSAAVYAPGPDSLAETATPGPVSPYGRAKLAAENVAAQVLDNSATGLTLLRLANLAGADALLGNCRQGQSVTLDPIAGQTGGPQRSYIGPRCLAQVLSDLIELAAGDGSIPRIVNLAQPGPVSMADLLTALNQPWTFGAPRAGAVGRVVLATDLLATLVPLPQATPATLVADMLSIPGWPR